MTVLRLRGPALPDGEIVDIYADGDRWTTDPVPGAELIEGWLLPGLVDAHTHPGAAQLGDPLDDEVLRDDLHRHVDSGVTLIRAPGLAGDPPGWFGRDPDVPRALHAGPWIAQFGQFFDGWGRRADHDKLPGIAAEQAARTGWAKIIMDWRVGDEPVPLAVISEIVTRVHAVGGRVAVHSQHTAGGLLAVRAGVDSIEHGMCLDPELLPEMADRGIALTPTLAALQASIPAQHAREDSPTKRWQLGGRLGHAALTAAAVEAGVTVLAGTDSRPMGGIVAEVRAMVEAGVPPHDAVGAASWSARAYLGLAGLVPGAPADAVVYAADPRTETTQLDHPRAVILRGVRVR
ncbi:amidohydrolase family protein [Winogradskya consettensis]|uniref:Amidohydrolase n=1 Tax=Winogradskya consettensis TaxID=113560 RepID=A0A919SI16_9ACTN|nr:amidohydrolase family protein [Actinoplanes consettensis]GIM71897.1 amidohydrolase [Actinoplanes consettensis]